MKKIVIYFAILTFISCSTDNKFESYSDKKSEKIVDSKNKSIYEIGRVQTMETMTCIGSTKPINDKEVILFNFDLDDDGKVKKSKLVKSEIASKADQNCIKALKNSSMNRDFQHFYKINLLDDSGIANHFILGTKDVFLIDPKGVISLDINNDKVSDYFNMCYSSEGVHFNIWDSLQKQKKLFHDYVYLDFDTIETCNEKDYENI